MVSKCKYGMNVKTLPFGWAGSLRAEEPGRGLSGPLDLRIDSNFGVSFALGDLFPLTYAFSYHLHQLNPCFQELQLTFFPFSLLSALFSLPLVPGDDLDQS